MFVLHFFYPSWQGCSIPDSVMEMENSHTEYENGVVHRHEIQTLHCSYIESKAFWTFVLKMNHSKGNLGGSWCVSYRGETRYRDGIEDTGTHLETCEQE